MIKIGAILVESSEKLYKIYLNLIMIRPLQALVRRSQTRSPGFKNNVPKNLIAICESVVIAPQVQDETRQILHMTRWVQHTRLLVRSIQFSWRRSGQK